MDFVPQAEGRKPQLLSRRNQRSGHSSEKEAISTPTPRASE
jgi:hypothetical protein